MRAVGFAVAASFLVIVGCGRQHLTPAYGAASRTAFAMQQVNPTTPAPPPSMALDTQEAEVIGRSYVRGLAGKSAAAEPDPVLYLSPQRQSAPAQLPPSVPRDRE